MLKRHNWRDLVENRFGWLFIRDLVELNRFEEVLSIINEIEHLEKPDEFQSHSKEVQISTRGLKGLHYKHYIKDGFVTIQKLYLQPMGDRNSKYSKAIESEFYSRMKNTDKKPLDVLLNLYKEQIWDHYLMRLGVEDEATLKLKRRLEAEGKSIRKLTGDFIIFHPYKSQNYYLALWKHNNETQENKALYDIDELKKGQQIKEYCKKEFPEFSEEILSHI
jgi:hypothetical protein